MSSEKERLAQERELEAQRRRQAALAFLSSQGQGAAQTTMQARLAEQDASAMAMVARVRARQKEDEERKEAARAAALAAVDAPVGHMVEDGWVAIEGERPYVWHVASGLVAKGTTVPREEKQLVSLWEGELRSLPEGWGCAIDSKYGTGRVFYFCVDGRRQWSRPTATAPPSRLPPGWKRRTVSSTADQERVGGERVWFERDVRGAKSWLHPGPVPGAVWRNTDVEDAAPSDEKEEEKKGGGSLALPSSTSSSSSSAAPPSSSSSSSSSLAEALGAVAPSQRAAAAMRAMAQPRPWMRRKPQTHAGSAAPPADPFLFKDEEE
jgi:hypothetical protein